MTGPFFKCVGVNNSDDMRVLQSLQVFDLDYCIFLFSPSLHPIPLQPSLIR